MVKLIQERVSKHFILYACIGITGVCLDLLGFYVLTHYFEINYQLANFTSTTLGITNNFLLNTFFNFRKFDQLLRRYLKFYAVCLLGLGITALSLHILVGQLAWSAFYVKVLMIGIVFFLQYSLNKKFSFSR